MNNVVKVIIKNLFVNIFLVIVKVFFGIIFNSTALVADGINSLTDIITDFVSLFGEEIAKSKKGKKKVIFEDKTSFFIGIIIIVLAIFMIIQSFDTENSIPNTLVIYVSIFVIIVKTIIVRYLAKMGKKLDNSIILSRAEESSADIITSVIALVAILLSQLSRYIEIFKYSDIIGALVIGIITLFVGLNIMLKNEKDIRRIEKRVVRMKLDFKFYMQDALTVATLLIGKLLVRRLENGEIISYRITETEAYVGEEDTACHARFGKTSRTAIMYERGGHSYIYLCYGIHYLLNVVTGKKDCPEAVLIRAVEGFDGPGKLTKRMNIDKRLNEIDLVISDKLWIEDDGYDAHYTKLRRVGIDYATEYYKNIEWRFKLI